MAIADPLAPSVLSAQVKDRILRWITATVPGADLRWLAERHQAIIDALTEHDPERAAQAMRVHAREAETQVLKARHDQGGSIVPVRAAEQPD